MVGMLNRNPKSQTPSPREIPSSKNPDSATGSLPWSLGFGVSLEIGVWDLELSFQSHPRVGVVGRHVGQNHLVADLQPVDDFDRADRSAAQFNWHAHGLL